ncbi:MAG: family 10 glycosylhydrolase [Kiritimatiellaeota bacterium]|nr:family 10 glycosylhydrolase [Kiritimatiellota bacterium]
MLLFRSLAVFLLWGVVSIGEPVCTPHTLYLDNFNLPRQADFAAGNPAVTLHGAVPAPGKWGQGLRVGPGRYATIAAEGNLLPRRGTLMFWFKSDWPDANRPGRSHTFFSWGWNDGKSGYCTLSAGWWEPAGANRTYLVFENQLYCHVSDVIDYRRGEWTHFAVTWEFGDRLTAAFYINGRRIGVTPRRACKTVPSLSTPIFLGSDRGTPMAAGRSADGVFDAIQILDRVLDTREVRDVFRAEEPKWREIEARRFAWLNEVLKQPWTPKRDADGRVLESRALLDESYGWATRQGAQAAVDKLARAGFNVFIPCVWHGRGARWPSKLTPVETGLEKTLEREGEEFDGLANLVRLCHARGIEVHPWFCVCYGDRNWQPLASFIEPGTPKGACEAHNPAFRKFIVELMLEVVRRYDVDGINLDYIRTKGVSKSRTALEAYRKRFGADLLEDLKKPRANGWPNARIVQFQNDAIADIVRRVSDGARAIRPNIIISIDGHPSLPDERPGIQGRDGFRWAREGWIDVLYSMDYGTQLAWHKYDAIRKLLHRPSALVVLCGNYERLPNGAVGPRDGEIVAKLIAFCQRKFPGNGVALYWLGSLDDAQIRALRAGPFKEPARPFWVRADSATPSR